MDSKELAKFTGEFKDKVEELLVELEYYRVFSRDTDGTIYNRRMVREAELSKKRAEAGRLGGFAKQTSSKPLAKDSSKRLATLESEDEDGLLLSLKERWNTFAEGTGLTAIRDIVKGSKRERALRARLAEKGFDFDALLIEVEASPFLLGKVKDFKATFDWILAPSNYQKIIEGNYRGTTPLDGPRQWLKDQEAKDADKR